MSEKINPVLRWLNVLLIFATFLSYLSPLVHPVKFWPASFFGLAYPWFLLLNLLFVLFWILKKERYFLFSLACIIIGWGSLSAIVGFNSKAKAQSSTIKVMSFNTHSLRDKNNNNKKLKIEQLPQFTQAEPVDIICLQEFPSSPSMQHYFKAMKEQTGMAYTHNDVGYGLYILSAYPIINKGGKYFKNRANGFQFIDIEKEGEKIRIYNIHLQSNLVTGTADKVANSGNLQEKETWMDIKGMMGKYRHYSRIRARQAAEISTHIAQSPYPVILCGDFNDVPQSHAYHILTQNMDDGFKKRGQGLGFTFSGDVPGLRIDYILAAPAFRFLSYLKRDIPFSDHKAIISSLELRN